MRISCTLGVFLFGLISVGASAQTPVEVQPDNVRRIPPPGINVSEGDRSELTRGAESLGAQIEALKISLKSKPKLLQLLPDVQIYHNAVRYAVKYNEFYGAREVEVARAMLKQGVERATQLARGETPWTTQTGLVARGYKSKIDNSIQPYGLVIPEGYKPNDGKAYRLDIWFHGRGENLSELNFLNDRQRNRGEFTPENTIVLHPYGRYCNANKFAGEVDTFEAMESVQARYTIDDNRVAVRGFSMGGAACWQFATHFAGQWAAAAPGAGFSETPDFTGAFRDPANPPTWYEQKLWHIYDGVDYAVNLFNCPTVAYSGEVDGQRQAAVMMEKALAKEGMPLEQIIGPKAGHFYEKNAKLEVAKRVDEMVASGRNNLPEEVKFTTWTLRYNEMKWLRIDGMEAHWDRARIESNWKDHTFNVKTENVSAFSIATPIKGPWGQGESLIVNVNGQQVTGVPQVGQAGGFGAHFRKIGAKWQIVKTSMEAKLAKVHGLQGPIDDAFMDSFVMVRPTGSPLNATTGAWVQKEMAHAVDHWRRTYRGEAQVKDDVEITKNDIANSNLVLWGDPGSNAILKRILAKLPLKWDASKVTLGKMSFDSSHSVPVMIYPNPLNPKKYIVLNSGFTFREHAYENNARQNAKLPDHAVVDVNTPADSRWPGKIVEAGFFGEHWEVEEEGR